MNVTARIYKSNFNNGVLGYGSICIDNAFVIDGVRVVKGKNGVFASMPSRKKQDGTYADVAYPITSELRSAINKCVLDAYGAIGTQTQAPTQADFYQPAPECFEGV